MEILEREKENDKGVVYTEGRIVYGWRKSLNVPLI